MPNRLVIASRDGFKWLPEWLLRQIDNERFLVCACRSLGKKVPKEQEIGDAETAAYLMTVFYRRPVRQPFANILLYLMERVLKRRGRRFPADLRCKKLTAFERQQLQQLKAELCRVRGKVTHPDVEAVEKVAKSFGKRLRR